MTESEAKPKKQMPKGGRKGGTLFPKIGMKQALDYSDKLVAKTHTGPQPEKTILPGVFGSSKTAGKVRASALKQFGLLQGDASAYEASPLAKSIQAAPPEEKAPLLWRAFLSSKLFKDIFETFHGDTTTKPKIRQQALELGVHPESAEECVDLFIESTIAAGLGTANGDTVTLAPVNPASSGGETVEEPEEPLKDTAEESKPEVAQNSAAIRGAARPKIDMGGEAADASEHGNKAGVTVSLTVDSSSDPDKLQKQLELLRKFGVI
jgi:hypothetical protein